MQVRIGSTLPNDTCESLCALTEFRARCWIIRLLMAQTRSPFLFNTPPVSFRGFLRDALIALGLPYGPQARQALARALPDLFGHSGVTLSGYRRWLVRTRRADDADSFAVYMEARYQRWRAAS